MSIQEIKNKIIPLLKPYGVTRAGLFGSAARGKMTKTSDVDVLVEMPKSVGLLEFVALKQELEETLGRDVDLVEYNAVKPRLKRYILKDHVRII